MSRLIDKPGQYNTGCGVVVNIGYVNEAGLAFAANGSGIWFADDGTYMDDEPHQDLNITGIYVPELRIRGKIVVCTAVPEDHDPTQTVMYAGKLLNHFGLDTTEEQLQHYLTTLGRSYPGYTFDCFKVNFKVPVK